MSKVLFINETDVHQILTMDRCIDAVDGAMRALSSDAVNVPIRSFMSLPEDKGVMAVMPGAAAQPPFFGLKVLSLLPDNPNHGRPTIQGFSALFDHNTGELVSIVESASVTAIRTAAASGLATRELARPDVKSHGILGTGVQSVTHAQAILSARPGITKTLIWGRDFAKAQARAEELSDRLGIDCQAAEDIAEVCGCDVISAVTASAEPLIQYEFVQPGSHINLVGSHVPQKREACSDTLANAKIYVDVLKAALVEAGDLLIPMSEGRISAEDIQGEIGEVLLGKAPARQSVDDITLYKSLGNAAQDLFAAVATYQSACEQEIGQWVTM